MNTKHSLKNTQGGFLHFLLMIVLLIVIMNYFHVGLGEVLNFISQILGYIVSLVQSILNALVNLSHSVGTPR